MGAISKCCCGDCCLSAEDMPYTSVTLIAPTENCEGGPGGGVGVGEGEDPPPPVASFQQFGCCHEAYFPSLYCQPLVQNCELWAKRKTDWGFTVKYYAAKKGYINTEDPNDCDCDCTIYQTKAIDATETVRVFFGQEYQLVRLSVNVGKVKIKCDGDEDSTCKFYIAVTYGYQVQEYASEEFTSGTQNKTCAGNYNSPECSTTTSWTEEYGEDSDTCPEGFVDTFLGSQFGNISGGPGNVTITRAKFYDTLPTGQVTIGQNDGVPFSCCEGKTGCVVTQPSCGLSFGNDRCLASVPSYPNQLIACALYTNVTQGVYNQCYEVKTNGMYSPVPYTVECVSDAGEEINDCFWDYGFGCSGNTLGVDRFVVNASSSPTNTGLEGYNICSTLDVDYLVPGTVALPTCIDGSTAFVNPFACLIDGCCITRTGPQGEILYNDLCNVFDVFCGRKIEGFTCSTARTDYTVGDVCLPLPNVTLEFA